MDRDRNKTNAYTNASGPSGQCARPNTCVHLQSRRQQQINSAKVLYRGQNFQVHSSDEDIFFDCLSGSDTDFPQEGKNFKRFSSCKSLTESNVVGNKPSSNRTNASSNTYSSGNASSCCKYEDPETVRNALKRAERVTAFLLSHFEKNRGDNVRQCSATLEITARLLTDPKVPTCKCCSQGRPVTVEMPLKFDPRTGQLMTTGASEQVYKDCPALMYTLHERGNTAQQVAQTDQSYVRDREAFKRQCFGNDIPQPQTQESPRSQLDMEDGSIELTKTSQTDTSYVYDHYVQPQGKKPPAQDKSSQTRVPEQDLIFHMQHTRAKRNLHDLDKIHYPTQYAWRTSNNLNIQQPKDDLIFECECAPNSSINDNWRRQLNVESRTQQQQTDLSGSSKSQPSIPSTTASKLNRTISEGLCKAIRSKSLPPVTRFREKSLPRAQQKTYNSDFKSGKSQNNTSYVSSPGPSGVSDDLNPNLKTHPISNNLSNLEYPCTQIDNATAFKSVESSQCSNPTCCAVNFAMPNVTSDVACQCSQTDRTTISFHTVESGNQPANSRVCTNTDSSIPQSGLANSHLSNVLSDVGCDNTLESDTNQTHSTSCECGSIYYTAKFSANQVAHSTEQIQLYVCPNPDWPSANSGLMSSNMTNETEKYLSSPDHTNNTPSCGRTGPGDNRRDENSYCSQCKRSRGINYVDFKSIISTGTNMTTAHDIESGRFFDVDRSHITTSINSQPVDCGAISINWESEISDIATRDFKQDEDFDQRKSEMNPLGWQSVEKSEESVDLQSSPAKTTVGESIARNWKNAQSEGTFQTTQDDVESVEEKQAKKSQQEEEAKRIENAERVEMGLKSPDETVSKDAKSEYFDADQSTIMTSLNTTLLENFTDLQSSGQKCLSELCQQGICTQQSRSYSGADSSHITTSTRHDPKDADISFHPATCCCRKSSMGCTDKSSSRSRSVMGKVTCLCSSAEKMKLGQAACQHLQGLPFARIRNPDVPSCSETHSTKAVIMNNDDAFCDCNSSSDTSIGGSTNSKKPVAALTTKSKSESMYQGSGREMSPKKPFSRMLNQESLRSDYKTPPPESPFSKSCITTSRRRSDEPVASMQFESVDIIMSCPNSSCIGEQLFEEQPIQENDRYSEIPSEGNNMFTCGERDEAAQRSLENQPHGFLSTQMHPSDAQEKDTAAYCRQSEKDFIYRSAASKSHLDSYRNCVSEFGYGAALMMACPSEQCGNTCRPQVQNNAVYAECTSEKQLESYRSCISDKSEKVCISKEHIVEILNVLSSSNETNADRTTITAALFRELNAMLRQMEEDEDIPKVPMSYEDCIATVAAGRKPVKKEPKSKEKLERMQRLDDMEKCLEKCFPTKKNPLLQPTEIEMFERNSLFDPFRKFYDSDAESQNASSKNFVSCNTYGPDSKTISLNSKISKSTDNRYLDCKSGDLSDQHAGNPNSIPLPEDENMKNSTSSGNLELTYLEGDSETNFGQLICLCSEDNPVCTQPQAQKDGTTREKDDATSLQKEDETRDKNVLDSESPKPKTKKCLCSDAANDKVVQEEVKKETDESAKDSNMSTQLTADSGAMQKRENDASGDPDWDDNMSPLTERERLLCEYMIRRMCELCGEEQGEEEATTDGMDGPGEPCVCCHCQALLCDNQCTTVTKTLDAVRYDPVAETKFFIDSIICDLQAMNHVMAKNKLTPKTPMPSPCLGHGPGESFPVTITAVSSLGCRALYVRWVLDDCTGVGGYEIYVDGHLTNRFYNARHESGVVANVDVTKRHQIVLRAQAVGYEYPGDEFQGNRRVSEHPELLVGAVRAWTPSVYVYEP